MRQIAATAEVLQQGATINALLERGISLREIARSIGWLCPGGEPNHKRVQRYLELYRQHVKKNPKTEAAPKAEPPSLNAFAYFSKLPPPRLTDIETAQPNTDQAEWLQRLHDLRTRKGVVTFGHACDIHTPYHDPDALALYYQLIAATRPDVLAVGSDFSDFALMSLAFMPDPLLGELESDELDVFAQHWQAHIDALLAASPGTVLVYLWGNHEFRLWEFIKQRVPKLRYTIIRRFIEIIRYQGRVLFLGMLVDHVRAGSLVVMHGNRHNVNVASSVLLDLGRQVNVTFGHVHRFDYAAARGEDVNVQAQASGMLGYPYPHYARGKMRATPEQGTVFVTTDLNEHGVDFTPVRFKRRDGLLRAVLNQQVFQQPALFVPEHLVYARGIDERK